MRARHGAPAAITAAAHKLARIIFHLVTTGEAYDESLFAAEEQRQRQRMENKLKRTAKQLGYQLFRWSKLRSLLQAASFLFIRSAAE